MNGCCVRRLLSHQLADILGKLGKEGTSEMHPARICKGFERSGNIEIARDLQQGRRIEVEEIIGDLLRRGTESGLSTPLLATAYAHLALYQNRITPPR